MIEMNIVEDFYYGSLRPRRTHFREGEYAGLRKTVSGNRKILEKDLRGEERHLFCQLVNAQEEILEAESRENFLEGWRLGARFMLDTFFNTRAEAFEE